MSTYIDTQLSISRNKHDMSQDMVPSSLSSIEHTLWDGRNICMVFVSVYRMINWKSDYQQITVQNLIGLNYWHKIWIYMYSVNKKYWFIEGILEWNRWICLLETNISTMLVSKNSAQSICYLVYPASPTRCRILIGVYLILE